MNRLTCRLRDRHMRMGIRLLVILIVSLALLSSCVDTKQADSNSDLREESDHPVHGEVGTMYGHTAR
ncbi:MAG: hypothetical protein WCE87_11275 [Candidatus Udaeobacter sp.]